MARKTLRERERQRKTGTVAIVQVDAGMVSEIASRECDHTSFTSTFTLPLESFLAVASSSGSDFPVLVRPNIPLVPAFAALILQKKKDVSRESLWDSRKYVVLKRDHPNLLLRFARSRPVHSVEQETQEQQNDEPGSLQWSAME